MAPRFCLWLLKSPEPVLHSLPSPVLLVMCNFITVMAGVELDFTNIAGSVVSTICRRGLNVIKRTDLQPHAVNDVPFARSAARSSSGTTFEIALLCQNNVPKVQEEASVTVTEKKNQMCKKQSSV